MNRLTQLLVLIFIALGIHPAVQAQNTCEADALPSEAKSLINKKFPDWRLKRISDLEDYDRELWIKAHPNECPGMAAGRFELPNQIAYCLLLIPKSGAEASYKIVVLSGSTIDHYSVRVLDHADGPGADSGLVISKVPPGEYSGFDSTQSIKTKLDAIEAEWLEKSSVLYFWKNGVYRTLQTSD